jgi:hypothetical protein
VLDPSLLQKGIQVIKEQMKDVQREALQIETEMERRFSDMVERNAQKRYLPKSITDEIIEHKIRLQQEKIQGQIGEPIQMPVVGYQQIREAIIERLGGTFDYAQMSTDLNEISSDLDFLRKEFR